ncbi:MAG: hypothetical protein JW778_06775, partial [Candidatus Altiarchaeota archaeon]|nr:hypothetical protein [Candidatus Altiarchaeota archaeon]
MASMRSFLVLFMVIAISFLSGCSFWNKIEAQQIVECPECDLNQHPNAQHQCMIPCMKKCLEFETAATTYHKSIEKGEVKCVCHCQSDAIDELNLAKAVINKDESYCEKIPTTEGTAKRDYCYIYVAGEKVEGGLCEKITARSGANSKDMCYVNLAIQTKNITLCDKIITESGYNSKDACFLLLAQ